MTRCKQAYSSLFLGLLLAAGPAYAQDDLEELAKKTEPSLVVVLAYDENGSVLNQGVGFLVGDERLIVASLASIERADVVEIRTSDGEYTYAKALVKSDRDWNVAVLRPETQPVPRGLELSSRRRVKVGTDVVAVGLPLTGAATVSKGTVTALLDHAGSKELMQISNELGPSNVGGPVVDKKGRVVGVARSTQSGGETLRFAVPARVVRELVAAADEEPERVLSAFADDIERGKAMLRNFRAAMVSQCDAQDMVILDTVIINAISSGIGIYNSGDHLGCYLIYEGAGYKLLYLLRDRCKPASQLLSTALAEAERTVNRGQYSTVPGHKAWIMRVAFDTLLGQRDE